MGSRVDIYLEPHMPKSLDSITKFAPHLFPSTASHSPALSSCPQKNQQPIVTSLSGCTTPSSRESTSYRPNKQGQALNMYAHRIFHDGGQSLPIYVLGYCCQQTLRAFCARTTCSYIRGPSRMTASTKANQKPCAGVANRRIQAHTQFYTSTNCG